MDLGNGVLLVVTDISITRQRRFSIDVTSQLQAVYQYDASTLPVVIPLSEDVIFDFDTPNTSLTADITVREQATRGTQSVQSAIILGAGEVFILE